MPEPVVPEAVDLIRAKRDGRALTDDEIRWLIAAYTGGTVADEQMSALLMAVYFQGLGPGELRAWTAAMVSSGERLDLGVQPGVHRVTRVTHPGLPGRLPAPPSGAPARGAGPP